MQPRLMCVPTLVRVIGGAALFSLALCGCGSSSEAQGSTSSASRSKSRAGLTDQQYVAAVVLAQWEARTDDAHVTSATATIGRGPIAESNLGYRCESDQVLNIRLIGTFPDVVTTGHPTEAQEDYTVHAVLLTADAESGRACLRGVQTGDVEPEPRATVLTID